ncbi:chemotaxis protein CheR [Geomonas paludis]|uniref:Chemotaxis protein CheR n=1 Tax=Geomonas paludis TaxID=2740185 RepID=A0A6V8MZV9_9BACT|nr:CheR family methyltransferase [Geomonas paludis]UPU34105.1 chemotaxis protein CheR [Geomonas paludis]GFO65620.1 protein-glutamate O-methyltransferase [Geomonas paludis]
MAEHPHQALRSFAAFVGRNTGLHFPEARLRDLAQKMTTLAREAGCEDLDHYLSQLMAAPLSRQQMKSLCGALTIGETYFLRDPKSYRVLERHILPGLIAARRRGGKTLKIWSAGCSTGEEPYSIAIILSRLLHDLPEWNVTLLGTDINEEALERAQRGVYGKWSFRNAPQWLMEYFTPVGEGHFEIVPRIRSMVHFSQLNLAEDRGSAFTSGADIIFCRNVMLYFHPEQIETTVGLFHAALKPGGWLFVGPTEVDHQKLRGFSCHHYDGALVLRKGEPRRKAQRPSAPVPAPAAAARVAAAPPAPAPAGLSAGASSLPAEPVPGGIEQAQDAYRAGQYQEAARLALLAPHLPEHLALAARCYANLGRYQEAREHCEKALLLERLDAHTHYLHSMILEQMGDGAAAEAALKRALYLDHDYLLAYFALGNLCRKRGELREAEQSFANALRLLQRYDPAEVLPDAEGITAGLLTQLIKGMNAGLNRR